MKRKQIRELIDIKNDKELIEFLKEKNIKEPMIISSFMLEAIDKKRDSLFSNILNNYNNVINNRNNIYDIIVKIINHDNPTLFIEFYETIRKQTKQEHFALTIKNVLFHVCANDSINIFKYLATKNDFKLTEEHLKSFSTTDNINILSYLIDKNPNFFKKNEEIIIDAVNNKYHFKNIKVLTLLAKKNSDYLVNKEKTTIGPGTTIKKDNNITKILFAAITNTTDLLKLEELLTNIKEDKKNKIFTKTIYKQLLNLLNYQPNKYTPKKIKDIFLLLEKHIGFKTEDMNNVVESFKFQTANAKKTIKTIYSIYTPNDLVACTILNNISHLFEENELSKIEIFSLFLKYNKPTPILDLEIEENIKQMQMFNNLQQLPKKQKEQQKIKL